MPTRIVTNTVLTPDGTPVANAKVRIFIRPTNGFRKDNFSEVAPLTEVATNSSGVWSSPLECNDNINPGNTYYAVVEEVPSLAGGSVEWTILVLTSLPASNNLVNILTDPLDTSGGGSYLTPAQADALFLTQAEADALYDPLGSSGGATVQVAYVHNQGTPASVWTITHGLTFKPNVTVIDSAGDQVEGSLSYTLTQVILTFAAAFSGVAYLS